MLVVLIGIVLNTLMYMVWKSKDSFAFATLLSALIWLILCIKDHPSLRFNIKEISFMLLSIIAFISLGILLQSILGFIFYILIEAALAFILLKPDALFLCKLIKSEINRMLRRGIA